MSIFFQQIVLLSQVIVKTEFYSASHEDGRKVLFIPHAGEGMRKQCHKLRDSPKGS